MTTDPKALADDIERLVQGEVQRCVLNLTQEEWSTILAALRAASSADTMRERNAFHAGFWAFNGPANEREFQREQEQEAEAWKDYSAALAAARQEGGER